MIIMMLIVITILCLCGFLFFYVRFPANRREMLWAGGLSVPLVLLWTISGGYIAQNPLSTLVNTGLRIMLGFSFAAVISFPYEIFFYKHLKLKPHPHRSKLAQLLLGPVVFLTLALVFQQLSAAFLLAGFLVEILVLVYHRKELLWEAVVSGLLMAIIYLVVFLIISRISPDNGLSLWIHGFSGIDVLGQPIEELIFVFGYGLLWGPLYEGVKRGQL